jgi:hypothetical protein
MASGGAGRGGPMSTVTQHQKAFQTRRRLYQKGIFLILWAETNHFSKKEEKHFAFFLKLKLKIISFSSKLTFLEERPTGLT